MSTFSEDRQWLGTVWEEIPFFLITSKFYFCTWIFVLGSGWSGRGTWCSVSQKGQPSMGAAVSCMHCSVALEIWKLLPLEAASQWSGHILHLWTSPRVMQSWCNLKSGWFTGFAFLSIREKPSGWSPQKSTHRSDHVACCSAREIKNQRPWRLLLFFLSPLPANTVPIFYRATTQ